MYKIFYAVAFIAVLGLVACGGNKTKTDTAKEAETTMHMEETMDNQLVYYNCPMKEHSHVASKEPGTCEECGMTLVAVVKTTDGNQDFYGCPMAEHSHIRGDEPGKCPECGMALRPLKFDM